MACSGDSPHPDGDELVTFEDKTKELLADLFASLIVAAYFERPTDIGRELGGMAEQLPSQPEGGRSWRIKDGVGQITLARAFRVAVTDYISINGNAPSIRVTLIEDEQLGAGQHYLHATRADNPSAPSLRGLLDVSERPGQRPIERILRLDEVPPRQAA